MPVIYTYQDTAVLTRIAPELIQTTALQDPIFRFYPIREHPQVKVRWRVKDNYRGLMSLRGWDGSPTRVLRPGDTMYEELAGTYGEFTQLEEQELTERAGGGFPADMERTMDVSDMVRDDQMLLTIRQVQRMRYCAWQLAINHNLAVSLPLGGIGHQAQFAGQAMTVATLWSNLSTATPLHDLRQLQFLYGRGTSNNFMGQATGLLNLKTQQYILDNRNSADVGGVRAEYGNTMFNDMEKFNALLLAQSAPRLETFEDSYQDFTGVAGAQPGNTYNMYLPDGTILVVAARPGGELPGEFMWTKHAINGGGTKPYAFVNDYTKSTGGIIHVPPKIEVHQGFNGGPVQERPSQTVTLQVA